MLVTGGGGRTGGGGEGEADSGEAMCGAGCGRQSGSSCSYPGRASKKLADACCRRDQDLNKDMAVRFGGPGAGGGKEGWFTLRVDEGDSGVGLGSNLTTRTATSERCCA